jgi:nucleotide-binding universal stress UspA family protein
MTDQTDTRPAGGPTVVVATDGSDHAERAARKVADLIHPDAHIVIASAMLGPDAVDLQGTGFAGPTVTPQEAEELRRSAQVEASGEAASAARAFGSRPVTEQVIEGEAGPALAALAEQLDADLIVVGSHGKGIVGRFLEGSVSRYLLDHAHCPVLVVPPADR